MTKAGHIPLQLDARSDVFDYIERFYNPVRKHSKLDFLSPVQFEEGLKG